MQKVYLVCSVPGGGKSWVCDQLKDYFHYIPNDDFIGKNYVNELVAAARISNKPVLGDCPFGERLVRDELLRRQVEVEPVFICEDPQTIKKRYESQRKHPIPTQHLTRAINLHKRAQEWRAFYGKTEDVLSYLKRL